MEILNLTGQEVFDEIIAGRKAASVNVSALPGGIYLIKVTTAKGIKTGKITIIH